MRPNVAQDAPPTSIVVGGFSYNVVDTDFRVWLEIMRLMRQLSVGNSPDGIAKFTERLSEIQTLVFGGVLADENPIEVLSGIKTFLDGYPSAPRQYSGQMSGTQDRLFSFDYDLNEIIIAIWNQHHINLMHDGEKCHWWMFLLYFKTLCGEHVITNLMQARGYKGKDKEMLRHKRECALPVEYTEEEKKEMDAFIAMFEPQDDLFTDEMDGDD